MAIVPSSAWLPKARMLLPPIFQSSAMVAIHGFVLSGPFLLWLVAVWMWYLTYALFLLVHFLSKSDKTVRENGLF